jgi:hypothetical protein
MMTDKEKLEVAVQLLQESVLLCNFLPRTKYRSEFYTDSYQLASNIDSFLNRITDAGTNQSPAGDTPVG